MGYWCTIHLFDDQKFYNDIVPALKDTTTEIKDDCLDFLKYQILGGISRLSEDKIEFLVNKQIRITRSIANSFDETFKIHKEFSLCSNYDQQRELINNLEGYDDFCHFFQYMIFKYCSDFYPQLHLGKGQVYRNFQISTKTLSFSIISELDRWNDFLYCGMMGITNWLTAEEVELLYLDKHNLIYSENNRALGFLNILEIANKNKLGLIAGIDLRERMIALMPQNKLINSDMLKKTNVKGVSFDIHKRTPT